MSIDYQIVYPDETCYKPMAVAIIFNFGFAKIRFIFPCKEIVL